MSKKEENKSFEELMETLAENDITVSVMNGEEEVLTGEVKND